MPQFTLNTDHLNYVEAIETDLLQSKKHSKPSVEKLAKSFGISNKNLIKELTELAIVRISRQIAQNKSLTVREQFDQIVLLYNSQVNLSHRTSHSMLLQQYSTPAPIAFLAGRYILNTTEKAQYFEPSAGNGLLTIALPIEQTIVNEIDEIRSANLNSQPFAEIAQQNAIYPFTNHYRQFEGIITNPPFGTLDMAVKYGDFQFRTLDHIMALRALDTMKDQGHAAIIIGGHTIWDHEGRIQAGKNRTFFNYLYHNYKVDDVLQIDGHKLYSRQGTSFDVRLILISGRKEKPEGYAPLKSEKDTVIYSFDELWERISVHFKTEKPKVVPIEKQFYQEIKIGEKQLKIFKVNAQQIRDHYDSDWNQGGHHTAGGDKSYEYIPKDEIWIDGKLSEKDTQAVILHEVIEVDLMNNQGMNYDDAHELAKTEEQKFRDGLRSHIPFPQNPLKNKLIAIQKARARARIRVSQ